MTKISSAIGFMLKQLNLQKMIKTSGPKSTIDHYKCRSTHWTWHRNNNSRKNKEFTWCVKIILSSFHLCILLMKLKRSFAPRTTEVHSIWDFRKNIHRADSINFRHNHRHSFPWCPPHLLTKLARLPYFDKRSIKWVFSHFLVAHRNKLRKCL